jgi:hypothetical protein
MESTCDIFDTMLATCQSNSLFVTLESSNRYHSGSSLTVMSEIPANANSECVGPSSDRAGKESSCAGMCEITLDHFI